MKQLNEKKKNYLQILELKNSLKIFKLLWLYYKRVIIKDGECKKINLKPGFCQKNANEIKISFVFLLD